MSHPDATRAPAAEATPVYDELVSERGEPGTTAAGTPGTPDDAGTPAPGAAA